jgi:hypothetical protein
MNIPISKLIRITAATFIEVRTKIFDKLRQEGWKIQEKNTGSLKPLDIPYATSPNGKTRLWFKAQAVYGSTTGATNIKGARSWCSDIREYADPEIFMRLIKWWEERE